MKNVYENVLQTVGNTPLVRLNKVTEGLACNAYCKLEMLNPGSSIKDRIALQIINDAEESGEQDGPPHQRTTRGECQTS